MKRIKDRYCKVFKSNVFFRNFLSGLSLRPDYMKNSIGWIVVNSKYICSYKIVHYNGSIIYRFTKSYKYLSRLISQEIKTFLQNNIEFKYNVYEKFDSEYKIYY